MIKLGVNIDHVATLREARKGRAPDVIDAAKICEIAGAHLDRLVDFLHLTQAGVRRAVALFQRDLAIDAHAAVFRRPTVGRDECAIGAGVLSGDAGNSKKSAPAHDSPSGASSRYSQARAYVQ